jgi:hypothetical protein
MKKFWLVLSLLGLFGLSSFAIAEPRFDDFERERVLQYLQDNVVIERERSNRIIDVTTWFKAIAPERKFEYRAINQLEPFDGLEFMVTAIECKVDYIDVNMRSLGSESRRVRTDATRGRMAVWQASKNHCVNSFTCSIDVTVMDFPGPKADATVTFGPYFVPGGPIDCFEYVNDRFST